MSIDTRTLVNQNLLSPAEVSECIGQGHHWKGNGYYWPMRELRDGYSGQFAAQRQGGGIDYSETRPYQLGDEPRHMNWRATARTGRPQVRVFQQDLTPSSYFLIDRRSNMRFGTRQRLKVTQAARLAVFFASWEARSGAELGSLILNESMQWLPSVGGHEGIHQLAQMASKPCPPLFDLPDIKMKQVLALLAEQLPAGSHLYLLSDFFDLEEDCLPHLYQLSKQHRVWMVNIYDSAELQLPKAGHLQLVWNLLAGTVNNKVDTLDEHIQQQHRLHFEQKQQKIKNLCNRAGILFSSMSGDENNIAKALQKGFL